MRTRPLYDVIALPARIGVGIVFIAHGWQKIQVGITATSESFDALDVPAPTAAAIYATFTELLGGLALIVGLGLPVAGALLFLDMAGAFVFVHSDNGLFVLDQGKVDNGFELVLVLGLASLLFAAGGGGRLTLDNRLFQRRTDEAEEDLEAPWPPPPDESSALLGHHPDEPTPLLGRHPDQPPPRLGRHPDEPTPGPGRQPDKPPPRLGRHPDEPTPDAGRHPDKPSPRLGRHPDESTPGPGRQPDEPSPWQGRQSADSETQPSPRPGRQSAEAEPEPARTAKGARFRRKPKEQPPAPAEPPRLAADIIGDTGRDVHVAGDKPPRPEP